LLQERGNANGDASARAHYRHAARRGKTNDRFVPQLRPLSAECEIFARFYDCREYQETLSPPPDLLIPHVRAWIKENALARIAAINLANARRGEAAKGARSIERRDKKRNAP